jgi:hypothetical protein
MNHIKEKYDDIKKQIDLLQDIKQGDKIYFYNDTMYLQSSTLFQSIYRTLTRENRDLTFKYLESFIGNFIHFVNQTKNVIKYVQDENTDQIVKDIPRMKSKIITIINILNETYPENNLTLCSLDNFVNLSC